VQHSLRVLMASGATLALTGLGIATPALAAPPGPPAVLHVGQIGRQTVAAHGNCEPDTLVEPDIAVSPFNTKIEVAVAHDCRFATGGAVDIFYAWTHDGGAHWNQSRLPGLTKAVGGVYDRASDPVVAFGSDGSVYVSSLVIDINNCDSGVAVSRSTDGGATFADPVFAQQSTSCGVSDDKNWLVTDTQPNSPFFGRIYQFWTEFLANGTSPQVLRWSDNMGKTWSSTHVLDPKDFAQNSQPFVQPDGAVTDTYLFAGRAFGNDVRQGYILRGGTNANSGTSIVAQTSFDGGAHWTKHVVVARNIGGGPAGIRCCLPMMNGDHMTGRMFQVWNANGPGVLDPVEISSSTDGGQHWSSPVKVTPGNAPNIQYINAAVATAAGRVFVSYGRRDLNDPNIIQQELTWSDDGGATFATPIVLGPPSNLRYAAVAGGKFPGDYTGLSATPARVAGTWTLASKPPSPTAAFHQVLYAATLHT
jgi:BNR repeat protein